MKLKGEEGGISIVDDRKELTPEAENVLQIVGEHDLVLSTGHISVEEVFVLLNEARRFGVKKIIIDHPNEYRTPIDQLKRMVQKGAYIGLYSASCMPFISDQFAHVAMEDFPRLPQMIQDLGESHIVIATDLGQYYNPNPVDGLRLFIINLLAIGISEKSIEVMIKDNPATLLGL